MNFTKTQIIFIGAGLLLILFIVLLFLGVVPGLRSTQEQQVTGNLTVWGVYDSAEAFAPLIAGYQAKQPGVSIEYRQMDSETYEEDLINALSSGRGPDIYMIKNTWTPREFPRLVSLTESQFPRATLENTFPSVVEKDFAFTSSTVSAFPLYLDTLVMLYNKELLDAAGFATAPATWEELEAMVPRLRSVDATQKIKRAAVALGSSDKSVTHAADLVSLFLLQHGVTMTDSSGLGEARFSTDGEEPFKKYLAFANPGSNLYTWNENLGNDFDAFVNGNVAIVFGYQSDIKLIKEKNPFLDFAIAAVPQRAESDRPVTYPSYWGLAVSATSQSAGLAWDFIGTATLNPEIIAPYLEATSRTPALRSMLAKLTNDANVGVFARQALTAQSWSQVDASAINASFSEMITAVLSGRLSPLRALQTSEDEITQLMRKRSRQTF